MHNKKPRTAAAKQQLEFETEDGRPWEIFESTRKPHRGSLSLVSLFAGCGGFDLGFRQAGFKTVWANDIDDDACQSFTANLGDIVCGDVNAISVPELSPDVVTAGFPCQSFSNAGSRRGTRDSRGTLYQAALLQIQRMQPKAIVFENVRGLLSVKHEGRFLIEEICHQLWSVGYRTTFRLVDASDYRVPQRRLRLIIVGLRKDLFRHNFLFPPGLPKSRLSIGETLAGLKTSDINNDELMPLNPQALEIGAMVPEGGSWKDIPYAKLPERLKRIRDNMALYRWPKFYRRFHRDEIAGTITAAFKPENAGVWHPIRPRVLSVREVARIQTFPDWYVFKGRSIKSKYQQIGNAVPPRLAYEIARSIRSVLNGKEFTGVNGHISLTDFIGRAKPLRPADGGVVYP
jgi:DNA (cytosine-5)-methyltransferase 1